MSTHQPNRMKAYADEAPEKTFSVQERIEEYGECIAESVRTNPVLATLTMFGVGLTIGACIGSALAHSPERKRHHLTDYGRQLFDSASSYMPKAIQRRI